jgi:mutT/nudix family phosphohydrolase
MQRWTDRGAAIIAQGDKIILMRRERGFGKNKQIYYTIPGGGREEGEKIEETAIREIKEELGIDIKIKKLMYKLNTYMRMQYIFLGEYVSGILGTGEGEEYEEENYKKYGKYIPQVVSFEKLKKIKLVPETLKKEIIRDYLYIIGKSKKKYTLKILQEESKKRIQNRKYLRKEETSNINNRKNASNKALISNKKRDFLKNDITLDEKNKLKRVIKKQESYKEKIEKLNKETKDKSIRNTNNKRKNNYISKSKNNNKIKDENKNKNEKREFVEKRKFKNRENIKKRNNKIKKKNVTKK